MYTEMKRYFVGLYAKINRYFIGMFYGINNILLECFLSKAIFCRIVCRNNLGIMQYCNNKAISVR